MEGSQRRILGQRRKENEEYEKDESIKFDENEKKYKKSENKLSARSSLLILLYLILLFLFVVYMDSRLPAPKTHRRSASRQKEFLESEARTWLSEFLRIGPRPAGSYENEVLAIQYLRNTLGTIANESRHKIHIDVQKPRGSFNLRFVDGLTHHYRNIQNLIVKLEYSKNAKDSILINCHFDSVPSSPGASDDAVSCVIMMGILKALSLSEDSLSHDIIFLFNGAEENMLPASHGFITQHMWAENIRAFINLEACGAGGRELVFQSGPEHPWLIEAYAKTAPYPFASVIGQEVFQSGIIPADTDFRIFRDFGHIPGLDIAYMKNGYVYHTKYDTEDKISAGSIQRAGDNVLAVLREMANSDIVDKTDSHRHGNIIFFDFLGLFLITYSESFGCLINVLVILLSLMTTVKKVKNSLDYGVSTDVYLKQLIYTFFVQVSGSICSLSVVSFIAISLDAFNSSLSWYSRPSLILFLYMIPTLLSVVAVFHFALSRQLKIFRFVNGVWAIESLYFEVSKVIWTFFCAGMTILRIHSSFFCTLWIVFPLFGRFLLELLYDKRQKGYIWLFLHLLTLLIPLLFNMYLIYTTFSMFIPIMGRSGSHLNPDLLIGLKAAVMTLTSISFICPLIMVIRKPSFIITGLYMSTIITLALVLSTSIGFPYRVSSDGVIAPHRSLIFHTAREFYNKAGEMINSDSGFFVINLDRNSPRVLTSHISEYANLQEVSLSDCERHLYCGMPMYYPVSTMLKHNHWIPTKRPRIYQETSLQLLLKEEFKPHVLRLNFRINGPDHMGIYISPAVSVKMTAWSFEKDVFPGPIWKDNRPTYYIFCSHGITPTPWEFWLEFQVPKTYTEAHDLLDIVVTSHIIHGNGMKTQELKDLLVQFPEWAYPVGWVASYKSYKF